MSSSIVWSLERLFEDPVKIEMKERERRQDLQGGPTRPDGDPPVYRCKACGLEAPERSYCPDCLADTMQPVT